MTYNVFGGTLNPILRTQRDPAVYSGLCQLCSAFHLVDTLFCGSSSIPIQRCSRKIVELLEDEFSNTLCVGPYKIVPNYGDGCAL